MNAELRDERCSVQPSAFSVQDEGVSRRAARARAPLEMMYQPDNRPGRAAAAHPQETPDPTPGAAFDAEEPAVDGETAGGATCLRVLVVDDAPDVTELLALLMEHAGYEVQTAFSAAEAFDAARGQSFDAVISDIGMPGMNGYQLAEALRALPGYEHTPLIAVTGFTQYEDRERARRAGFNDFLHKPISPSDLLDAVRRLCG
jgi:CheY-like chemotaxis protein